MKRVFWIRPIIFSAILLLVACKKEKTSADVEYQITHWPVVKTLGATKVDSTIATLNGTVNGYGLATTVIFEYGTTTSYGSTVTAFESPVTGYSITHVSAEISGLTPCTAYYFRVKAENSKWINFYSPDLTFVTCGGGINTMAATNVSHNKATLNGFFDAHSLSTNVIFAYGKSTGYENFPAASQSPVIGKAFVTAVITDLVADTTYHFRIQSEEPSGQVICFGSDMEFIAKGLTINTVGVTNITDSSAVATGYISGDVEDVTERGFALGIPRPRIGYNWTLVKDTNGTGTGNFQCNLTGLQAVVNYRVKAYAINDSSTVNGNVLSFKTSE